MQALNSDEYLTYLRQTRQEGTEAGVAWRGHSLKPQHDIGGIRIGWMLRWHGVFADNNGIFIKEDWSGNEYVCKRIFFSYHYGPVGTFGGVEKAIRTKGVVRIDGIDYGGRGFHIHDLINPNRIFQDELESPIFGEFSIPRFISCVSKVRMGQAVAQAFDMKAK